jgi:zinc/manganese transport system permease protein
VVSLLIDPFVEFGFMRRALVACLALGIAGAPLGVLVLARRMSLMGDALAHALLPGIAIGYVLAGLSVAAMAIGGLMAGLVVALFSIALSRLSHIREDAAFAAFYIAALALGVTILSITATPVDLMHILFGTVLAIDDGMLIVVVSLASVVLLVTAVCLRPLVIETFDPGLLDDTAARGRWHAALYGLLVVVLVAGYQAVGTLMTIGLLMLPALAGRFWGTTFDGQIVAAGAVATLSVVSGLIVSFHADVPTGPAIVLVAAVIAITSALAGPVGSAWRRARQQHRKD